MGPGSDDDVWGPLIDPLGHGGVGPNGAGAGQPVPASATRPEPAWAPEYLDRIGAHVTCHTAEAEVAATLCAPPAHRAEADPFEHYVPPALLPLDDVSLGLADELEGTGWIEAGAPNPLGAYMGDGPEEDGVGAVTRGRVRFSSLDLMGGPQRAELTRVERGRIAVRSTWARRVFALGVAVCLVFAVVGLVGSYGTEQAPVGAGGRPTEGSAVLLIQKDGAALTAVTLLVSQPGGGRVIFVPTGVGSQVPGVGAATIAAASADPGITAAAVADTLGVRIGHWIQTDSFGLEQLFGAFGSLQVDSSADRVAVRSAVRPGPGVDPELLSRASTVHAGPNDLSGRDTVAYLNAVNSDGELSRLARQADVWKAFFGRLHEEPSRATALLGANRLMTSDDDQMRQIGAVFAALAGADSVDYGVLPVLATARSADGTEAFRLDAANLARTVAALPADVVVVGPRPRLGITVGKGVGAATVAGFAGRVVPSDFDLVLSSTSEAAYDETLIVYSREAQRPVAEALRNRIGMGRVVKDLRDQDVVDVSVTLGDDAERAHLVPTTEQQPAAGIDDITDTGSN